LYPRRSQPRTLALALATKESITAMHITSLLEVIHAAHHSWLVHSPWEERGGILIIAPPGQLKTTIILSLEAYAEALCLSDLNIRSMKSIRDQVLGGRYKTLAFSELEKLYARNPATASNVEAHLKQFVEEGLRHFSHEDQSAAIMPARALVVGGITPGMYGKLLTAWTESGFLRRFLRIQYALRDEKVLLQAIHNWKKVGFEVPVTWDGRAMIKYDLEESESKRVMHAMRDQLDSTPTVLLKRICQVLKRRKPDKWKSILEDIAPALGRNGELLEL